jgi:hypothetical protein
MVDSYGLFGSSPVDCRRRHNSRGDHVARFPIEQ